MATQDLKTKINDAQRASILSTLTDLETELDEGFVPETVEVSGVLWTMQLLCDYERNWANRYTDMSTMMTMISSSRAPTLGIGIRAIGKKGDDGKNVMLPVEDFFIGEWEKSGKDLTDEVRRVLESSNPHVRQLFFAEQLFQWLSKRKTEFVNALWEPWSKMVDRRNKTEELMGKSSAADGNSGTSPTPLTTQTPLSALSSQIQFFSRAINS